MNEDFVIFHWRQCYISGDEQIFGLTCSWVHVDIPVASLQCPSIDMVPLEIPVVRLWLSKRNSCTDLTKNCVWTSVLAAMQQHYGILLTSLWRLRWRHDGWKRQRMKTENEMYFNSTPKAFLVIYLMNTCIDQLYELVFTATVRHLLFTLLNNNINLNGV